MVDDELGTKFSLPSEHGTCFRIIAVNSKEIGMIEYTFPHRIDNGHGEELTFLRLVQNENGGLLEVENKVKPGAGPPMHVHHLQDESLTVIQGRMGAQIAGQLPTLHGPGETITFKRGVAHKFWNAGGDMLYCKGWISPPHNTVYFLTEIFRSTKANGGHRPSMYDGAFLQNRFRSEFDMVEIPGFVKNIIFPLVLFFGRMTGKHHRFKDVPQPVGNDVMEK